MCLGRYEIRKTQTVMPRTLTVGDARSAKGQSGFARGMAPKNGAAPRRRMAGSTIVSHMVPDA